MKGDRSWFHKLGEIIRQLEAMGERPYLDRSTCQKLFGISKTATAALMRTLGAEQLGNLMVISRVVLIKRLKEQRKDPEWAEKANRRRVAEATSALLLVPAAKELEGRAFDDLPGVTLAPGVLTIRFEGGIRELFQKLLGLAQAISADMDRFEAAVTKPQTLSAG